MKDNTRTAIGYVCIAAVIMSYFLMLGLIAAPRDFTLHINMTSDWNMTELTDSIDQMQYECYENGYMIPCENFTFDEHFCSGYVCEVDGICPGYYEILEGKTVEDCIKEIENES